MVCVQGGGGGTDQESKLLCSLWVVLVPLTFNFEIFSLIQYTRKVNNHGSIHELD